MWFLRSKNILAKRKLLKSRDFLNPYGSRYASSKSIKKLLISNRGEIAIRIIRAAKELKIKTAAIYTHADSKHPYRLWADESYLIGNESDPVGAFLDSHSIVKLAKAINADAVHPGYGFLSENADFCRLCHDNGIEFIGPHYKTIRLLGNKVESRKLASKCGVPIIPGTDNPISSVKEAESFAAEHGFPIMLKAAFGGGGRGMRICRKKEDLQSLYASASSEAQAAFGNPALFVERYIENARHIEVQIIGDKNGKIIHLYDRDCSVQRRHQKVVEIAPAPLISDKLRDKLLKYAVELGHKANYESVGTVEFMVDEFENIYFIEVNSRVQVEHPVTEEVTGVDIVKNQIQISQGFSLDELNLKQDGIHVNGFAIQARVTTEDPKNSFVPDLGRISIYQSGGGPGIRLDGCCGYTGSIITPHYDSLLTKVIAKGKDFEEARKRMIRCLDEFKIEGVKTNIPFLKKLLKHYQFSKQPVTTDFISKTQELTDYQTENSNDIQILNYLACAIVNGPPKWNGTELKPARITPSLPEISINLKPTGWKSILDRLGPSGFAKAIFDHKVPLLTDTTLRDAHQSLLATRMRTLDMTTIAPFISHDLSNLLSLECWGGATFDVAMRFLHECPWDRLAKLRELIPNIPFQMLLRGASAVGYKNYPDNVLFEFVRLSRQCGMDIFRIFDALNYVPNIEIAIEAVNKYGGVAEAAICYSGDVSNPSKTKYSLEYYMQLSRDLVNCGAHILCIKDMAGVLKPAAAKMLVSELRKEFVGVPIHIHSHDTSGCGVATYIAAVEAGADIVDCACDSMSGMTSQPSLGAVVAALNNVETSCDLSPNEISKYSSYFEQARTLYAPFESTVTMKSGNADVFEHEIPGGQYTNLQFQAYSLGLGSQFEEIKHKYIEANELLGDIIKVTPTSKVVGDLAQFMVQNKLSKQDIVERAEELNFPNSVVEFFKGELGEPYQGYPEPLRTKILKGRSFITGRPGASLPPLDLTKLEKNLKEEFGSNEINEYSVMSSAMYPDVFHDYMKNKKKFGDLSLLPTRYFLDKCDPGDEVEIHFSKSKKSLVKFTGVGNLASDGKKDVFFDLNGSPISIPIEEVNSQSSIVQNIKADENDKTHISAPMPGQVNSISIKEEQNVKKGDVLFILSAMKMETQIIANFDGVVKKILVKNKSKISSGDLLAIIELRSS